LLLSNAPNMCNRLLYFILHPTKRTNPNI